MEDLDSMMNTSIRLFIFFRWFPFFTFYEWLCIIVQEKSKSYIKWNKKKEI